MCLMAVAPRKLAIPRDYLQNAFDHNSDGWGIMYAKDGHVITVKEKAGMDQFYTAWDAIPDNVRVGVHFRFGTSGPKNSVSCHPFPVLQKARGDVMDLWLMHNGVLRHLHGDKDASDTMQYVERIASQLKLCPALLKNQAWREDQEEILGSPNKVVFLEGNGRWHFLNYDQGKRYESGVWYSNEYSLEPVYCGHGMGKRATHVKDHDAWDHDYSGGYYGGGYGGYAKGASYGNSNVRTIGAPVAREPNWAIQIEETTTGKRSLYWKKLIMGWTRYERNESTGMMFRSYPEKGEKKGADVATVLPRRNIVTFHVAAKYEAAWMRGDKFSFEMEGGEHHAVPVVAKETTPAGAQLPLKLVDASTAANVADACGVRANGATFQEPQNATGTKESPQSVVERLTRWLSQRQEPFPSIPVCGETGDQCSADCMDYGQCTAAKAMSDRDEEEEDTDEAYITQLFSDATLRDLPYDDVLEAVQDYPEYAALALGRAHNCRWAWEDESEVA